MTQTDIFIIEYKLHGEPKSFVIRAHRMRITEAWHWASCNAGIAPMPTLGKAPLKIISKLQAKKSGITEVRWRETTALKWTEISS